VRAVGCLVLLALWPTAAAGAALTLTDVQRQEAVRAGERSVTAETFGGEWRVSGAPGESAVVLTPFHRLAMAARHAAFNGKPLRASDRDRILRQDRDRLVFWVSLRGPSGDFARHYVPRLVVGDRDLKPSFVQNEHTAARQEDGRYLARCVYGFPTRDVEGRERVALVVADAAGRDVARFTIDLAAMR
jgi:hypothetical protein